MTERWQVSYPSVSGRSTASVPRIGTLFSVDWRAKRTINITVPSPKTEHISGGASRVCPLLRELREVLEPYRKASGFVVDADDLRAKTSGLDGWANANLRSGLLDCMKRAGVFTLGAFVPLDESEQTDISRERLWSSRSMCLARQHPGGREATLPIGHL
jgi:hypothetical protein